MVGESLSHEGSFFNDLKKMGFEEKMVSKNLCNDPGTDILSMSPKSDYVYLF